MPNISRRSMTNATRGAPTRCLMIPSAAASHALQLHSLSIAAWGVCEMAECAGCHADLSKPFIRCAQCAETVVLCLHCFAAGFEQGNHSSDHCYEVIKDDFSLFNSSWTAGQEINLLDAITECGFDNWTEISERMNYETAEECRKHYEQFYIDNPQPSLPEMLLADVSHFVLSLPYKVSVTPPRPLEDSSQQAELSGYCCARSDFSVEHNNFAELDIKDMTYSITDTQLDKDMQLAILRIYRNILAERQRRKWIVRQLGLIDIIKHLAHCRRYEQALGIKSMEALRRLSCLFLRRPSCFELCLEALSLQVSIRQRITELQQYRQAGLRWLRCSRVYSKLMTGQHMHMGGYHLLKDVLYYIQDSYKYQTSVKQKTVYEKLSKNIDTNATVSVRRSAAPLDIVGLPGYDRLSHTERQLCSRVRLVPESYLEFRRILVSEHDRHGQLRLAQARTLIRIDVNKTRQIYNFLIAQGLISSTASSAT